MKQVGRVSAVVLCALLTLALPAAASAGQQAIVKRKSMHLNFHLPAGKSVAVSVETSGHRQIRIGVEKGESLAFYTGLGHVSRKGIEADLGRFGRVSLRFLPKSKSRGGGLNDFLPPPLRQQCRGRAPVLERGVLVGNIRFRGEHGYVRAVAHRVKADLVRSYKQVCRWGSGARAGASAAERDKVEVLTLSLEAHRQGIERTLRVFSIALPSKDKKHPEGLTIGIALRKEKVEGVGTTKGALVFDANAGIIASPRGRQPVTAEAKLPSPFAGTGNYLKEPGQEPTWSGDFGVHMLGNGLVPLTGEEFEFDFCRSISEREIERCIEKSQPPTPGPFGISPRWLSRLLAQGSGSHSQLLALARLSSLR
jgi:hypothetical protein